MPLFESVTDLRAGANVLAARRYGVIEMRNERLVAIHLRPWPKIISVDHILIFGRGYHDRRTGNTCFAYYNQPWRCPNFLALPYVVSARDCTLRNFHVALTVLDEIARIKRSDAIVCDIWNPRISDRHLARWGWQPHCPSRWHRNYIKRFYGVYPTDSGNEASGILELKA